MNYICHKRYKKKGASGDNYNIKYGTELNTISNFIVIDNKAICSTNSLDAYMYFSRNDDGYGFERGKLTYAIAFSDRKPNVNNNFRFTPEERDMLYREYPHFINTNLDFIIFNYDFFNANIEELQTLYNKLFK